MTIKNVLKKCAVDSHIFVCCLLDLRLFSWSPLQDKLYLHHQTGSDLGQITCLPNSFHKHDLTHGCPGGRDKSLQRLGVVGSDPKLYVCFRKTDSKLFSQR